MAYNRAEYIVTVACNDSALYNDCIQISPMKDGAAFVKYSRIVTRIAARCVARGLEPFTLREMADAIVLLHAHFSKEE